MKIGLRTLLFVCMAGAGVLPALFLGAQLSNRIATNGVDIRQREQVAAAEALAASIDQLMDARVRNVEAVAALIEVSGRVDPEWCQTIVSKYRASFTDLDGMWVGSLDGTAIASAPVSIEGRPIRGRNYSDRQYVQDVLRKKVTTVSAVQMGHASRRLNVHIAAPIRDRSGELMGYSAASISVIPMLQVARRAVDHLEEATAVVIDAQGNALAEPEIDREAVHLGHLPLFAPVEAGAVVRHGQDASGAEVHAAAARVPRFNWTVVVHQPELVFAREVNRARRFTWFVAAIALAASLVLAFVTSSVLAGPLRRLASMARSVAARDYSTQIERSERLETHETATLKAALGAMIEQLVSYTNELEARVEERTRALKAQAEELEVARDRALQASRFKSDFLANMSHEIRTPMNGVLGATELLFDTPLTAEQQDLVEDTRRSGRALLQLIDDILDLSKIEAGKVVLESVPFDVQEIVEDVAEMLRAGALTRNIELFAHLRPSAPRFVVGDPGRVRQVLVNLAGNAVKFTTRGHVLIEVDGETKDGVAHLRLRVADTGIGIPKDKLEAIFEKFTQADSSTTRRFGGTGLGLTISKELVALMGGHITVESEPGAGSTFTVHVGLAIANATSALTALGPRRALVAARDDLHRTILAEQLAGWEIGVDHASTTAAALTMLDSTPPEVALISLDLDDHASLAERAKTRDVRTIALVRTPAELAMVRRGASFDGALLVSARSTRVHAELVQVLGHPAADVARSAASERLPTSRRPRVLLVEDNQVNLKVASRMLEKLGAEVELATDGRTAVEMIERSAYDLVFMDCQMPEMDGFEATARVRALESPRRSTRIVALTANAMVDDRERCLASGMDDYLAKPLTRASLQEVFERWLRPENAAPQTIDAS